MTDNPWLIMAINMTIVFAVLILLGVLMHIIYLVDPTKQLLVQQRLLIMMKWLQPSWQQYVRWDIPNHKLLP